MEITDIKSQLSIQAVLSHYNLTPGSNHRLICPFHRDKTPSLQIYPKTNTWTCFSTNCTAGSGDVIDLILRLEARSGQAINKHQAIMKAKSLVNGTPQLVNSEINNPNKMKGENKAPINLTESINDLTRIAILSKYYQLSLTSLPRSPKAIKYATDRNLDYHQLGIGYSGGDIGRRWSKSLQDSGLSIGLLKKNGNNITPKIKYCLLFAMRNRDGQVIDLYGRSVIADNNKSKHFYLSGKQRGLYPSYPKPETQILIITESIIDSASLTPYLPALSKNLGSHISHLCLYGTNGWTSEHTGAIKGLLNLSEIVFFMDGDEAGRRAAKKWGNKIAEINNSIKICVIDTPQGEDINSLITNHADTALDLLSHLIKDRRPFNEFSFSSDKQLNLTEPRINEVYDLPKDETEISHSSQPIADSYLNTNNSDLLIYTLSGTCPEPSRRIEVSVLGGIRITGLDRMKVTLRIKRNGSNNHTLRHSLDLYHAKQIDYLIELMSSGLEIRSSQAAKLINGLTTELEQYRERRLEAMKPKTPQVYEMTSRDRSEGMAYLKDPNLMINTSRDIAASGIVGEERNAMIGYIIYLSRKREKPLHVMYLGASGSGKTHVQEGLGNLLPREDKIEATSLSDQALYYEGLKLKGKILFIEDIDGAENIMYVIRELQSKGKIVKRVAWRDNKGHTQTIEVVAEGPVVISSCTTHERVYEDNANRCILLYIDQSKGQDKRVMDYIKLKSAGKIKGYDQDQIQHRMQNSQRLLKSIKVYNPYAELIDFPPEVFKPRRSLPLLLGFIETVTFYHQYQREVKKDCQSGTDYIASTYEDIKYSFDLLKDVLFSKSDELSKSAREFLELLKSRIKKGDTFYTKKIRKEIRMNASNMKRYMIELQRYDYVKIKTGNRYRGYEYEITDYDEYNRLQSSIEKRLEDILLKINGKHGQ